VPGKAFHSNVMFVGKADQVLHSSVTYWPYPQALDLSGKDLPGTNTLTYYEYL
jgi:hypothetical protein